MVSAAWAAARLNPYAVYAKALAVGALCASLVAVGWVANGWRLGENVAQMEAKLAGKEAARHAALSERQARAMQDSLSAVLEANKRLQAERARNASLAKALAKSAPRGPEFACRDLPLPESYLENFRQ